MRQNIFSPAILVNYLGDVLQQMEDCNTIKINIPVSAIAAYLYCPRNAYYRLVEGANDSNHFLTEGKLQEERREEITSINRSDIKQQRQVRLESEYYGLVGEIDIVEEKNDLCYPVEYKRGIYKEAVNDDVQLCCQVLLLEEAMGTDIPSGYIYYSKSNKRRQVIMSEELRAFTIDAVNAVRVLWKEQTIPPPLNNERCNGCSLASRCMPEETSYINNMNQNKPKQLMPSKNLGRVLYVDNPGAQLHKKQGVIVVSKDNETLHEIPLNAIDQVVLLGRVNITTPLLMDLLRRGTPVYLCNCNGRLDGWVQPTWGKNSLLRIAQFQAFCDKSKKLTLAKSFVCGKLSNYRTIILRYNRKINSSVLSTASDDINKYLKTVYTKKTHNELLGVEGIASRCWFDTFPFIINEDKSDFIFVGRNRRPPRDPINILLSYGYSMLTKDIIGEVMRVGLDPYIGFLHSSIYGRPALALDLMEEFRPIIVDSAVFTAVNTGMVRSEHFNVDKTQCRMNEQGRKAFFNAYRNRMNETIVHPVFGYRVSYRRNLELQARMLAKVLTGEIDEYIPFMVR